MRLLLTGVALAVTYNVLGGPRVVAAAAAGAAVGVFLAKRRARTVTVDLERRVKGLEARAAAFEDDPLDGEIRELLAAADRDKR